MNNPRNQAFRQLFSGAPFACLGAHDPMSAKIAESVGAKALYISGFSASAVLAGEPDMGVLSQTEMAGHIRRIAAATNLPIFADADTGYGGPMNAARTIIQWEQAGASALHLEDQVIDKRCGHFAGKRLVETEEMKEKIAAMLEARHNDDFFVVARTDAIAVDGIDSAVQRLATYAECGVDGLYADAPENMEHLEILGRELASFNKPLLFNMVRSGKSPVVRLDELAALGFHYALCPVEPVLACHKTMTEVMKRFMETGTTDAIADAMTPFEDFTGFLQTHSELSKFGVWS